MQPEHPYGASGLDDGAVVASEVLGFRPLLRLLTGRFFFSAVLLVAAVPDPSTVASPSIFFVCDVR